MPQTSESSQDLTFQLNRTFDRRSQRGDHEKRFSLVAYERVPDGLDDDEAESFNAKTGDQLTMLEDRITATAPNSFAGAFVQISVLIFRVDAGHPHTGEPTLVDLQKGVEATLASIAAGQGATS